jgi:thiamine biosynthesis lipoprotein
MEMMNGISVFTKRYTRRFIGVIVTAFICLCQHIPVQAQHLVAWEGQAQGTYYIVKYVAEDTTSLRPGIDSILQVIDQSLSLYQPGTLINQFNAGTKVKMDAHMKAVVQKALFTSKATAGAFDITVKPLVDLWGFGVIRLAVQQVPPEDSIKKALQKVGYKYLRIKGDWLIKKKAGVEIDCNGIAQGYSSDVIARFLEQHGIHNYLVDVGGELCAKGYNHLNKLWSVGIERPAPGDTTFYAPDQAIVHLSNQAITTSGNYRRFFDQGGKRFAHTMDPITGQALQSNIISVTVIAKDGITADAFDNPLILMGVEKGLAFVRQHPEYHLEAYFIYKGADGSIEEKYTPGFEKFLK